MFLALALIIAAYIAGSIPTGYWLVKALKGIDIREHGSRSTGATNVLRTAGKGAGLATFVIDIAKGYLPVLIAMMLDTGEREIAWTIAGIPHVVPVLVALSAIIGHSKSIFLKGQGGKSAATGLGTYFALNPLAGLATLITFAVIVWLGRIVSVGSITAVALSPLYFHFLNSTPAYVGYAVLGFLYVTFRHKANIKRLMEGTEPRIGDKSKSTPVTEEDENAEANAGQSASSAKGKGEP